METGARARRSHAGGITLPLPIAEGSSSQRIEVEQAVPCAAAFDAEGWCFSVDWDGMRVVLAAGSDGAVRIHDERLADLAPRLPEVVGAATAGLRGRAAVLDGVLTLLDSAGRPDLGALFERLAAVPEAAPLRGLVLLVTDLLMLDGVSLHGWPLERRRAALTGLLPQAPHLQVPDVVDGQGVAVAEAAAERGLAAMIARDRAAPYRPGVASPQRLRVALEPRADTVIAGAVMGGARRTEPEALILAEWERGAFVDAGRAALTATPEVRRWLRGRIAALRRDSPSLPGPDDDGVLWLEPMLVATVRHHGRADDGRLRLPSPIALREDRPPRWCIRRTPVPPPAAASPVGSFRPTVITTLPLA